jgi:hypothetical protein
VLDLYALIIGATADQLRNPDGLQSALARLEAYAHRQSGAEDVAGCLRPALRSIE